ncbi:MAG: hypothetical protein K6F32_00470 [Bacilli bacterium]|nr:hypothetical protein [Bacilli bacterium]
MRSIYGNSVVETRIGFRDATWKEEGFFLNGKKVKLMGLNRHQNYPYFGPAAPQSLQIDDADIIKKRFGCNVVRTSHYADDESFLDRCDELGLLLLDEIPGWQFISQEPKWRDTLCDFARRLIVKERNHPCLIAYGLRVDESGDDHELYSRIQEIKKEFDPYRASTGVRNFKESELLEDIFSYNDFSGSSVDHGLDDPSTWKGAKGKPKLVTENNGHMFPTKSYDPTSWRIESALRHARVLDDAYGFDNLCGSLSWCAFDYNTHKDFGSNDHICHHGVADIWRNPKYSAYVYASQGETGCFEVISQMLGGDFNESLLKPAYVLSDCDEVVLYKNETKIKTFKPDRKDFPHLPHPPFKIDDWIGESFNEPNFNAKESKQIVDGLNFASQYGMGALSLKQKLLMAYMMAKKHLSFHDVSDLYIKYTFAWGGKSNIWTFVGIKDGKEVARKSLGPSTEFHYEIDQSKDTLKNEATYDAARVSVYKKDQYGTTMHFADDDIVLETIGPIEIMGPKVLHLVGGGTSIYVRSLSTKKPAEAKLIIKGISGTIEIPFKVE